MDQSFCCHLFLVAQFLNFQREAFQVWITLERRDLPQDCRQRKLRHQSTFSLKLREFESCRRKKMGWFSLKKAKPNRIAPHLGEKIDIPWTVKNTRSSEGLERLNLLHDDKLHAKSMSGTDSKNP